jgi:iron complex outermembrane receptor protein
MTNYSRNVRHAVRLALAACASTAAIPLAHAQQPAEAAPAPAEPVSEVVVTGSRIATLPNEVSISPITSTTAADIQQTGLVRTEDILNMLPQITAEQNAGTSISSVGVATVSLRDLGSQRTLVLINGKRMQPGGAGGVPGGNANSPDIDQIPADLIERADVLTGGASAVYGADAVAGVVNFILNTHYEGVKVDASYGFNNHSNDDQMYLNLLKSAGDLIPSSTVNTGAQREFTITAGANFADGKGNATAYFGYLNGSQAVGYEFDHAGCTLNGASTPGFGPISCGGSSTSGPGRFLIFGKTAHATTPVADLTVDQTTGNFRNYAHSDSYNYGALSYLQRPAERYTAGAFLHYDVNDNAQVYTETMFARYQSTAQYGPSGAFAFTSYVTSCQNPLLSAQQSATLCAQPLLSQNQAAFGLTGNNIDIYLGRRNVEGGGRLDNYTSDSIRQVLGVKGQFLDAFSYDVYGQVGITDFGDLEGNFLGTPQIANALDVVANPAVGGVAGVPVGQAVCAAALPGGSAPTCVPWDIYKPGGVTPAQLAYLSTPATYAATATEYVFDASVTGDFGKYGIQLPTAKNGLSVNLGTEWREEKYVFAPDYVFENGLQAGGAPSKPIDGQFRVWEAFTEARLPILSEVPGAYDLSAEAGYRWSTYTEGFNTSTYKFGVEYSPIKDIKLRGGYNRAVRAPNANELFEPNAVGAGGTADPCWGATPAFSLTECERTGVTPGEYGHITTNPAAQINTEDGGNLKLTPEIADTYTYGVVFQPEAVQNLVASVDYFYIKIRDTITSLTSNTVITNCALTGDAALCGLIHRGSNGSLWFNTSEFVTTTFLNIGSVSTRGLDVTSHYRYDLPAGLGRLNFNLVGTYTKDFLTQALPNNGAYNCAGYWGATCEAPLPHWRHVFTTNWGAPWYGLDFTFRWRFIGPSNVDRSSSNPQLNAPFYAETAHIPGYNYIDLSASVPVTSAVDFRVGVNNIADKNPPLVLNGSFSDCPNTTCNDNTWVGTYDTLGRYIYARFSVKF